MKFDFNEANILKQNLFSQNDTKEILIHRIVALAETTDDRLLRDSVFSLVEKLETLSEEQVQRIHSDIVSKRLIATANYNYGD